MPRKKDSFWRHVTFLNENNSKWRCNFCGEENSGGATRIKAHLAGIARYGIKGCERVNVDVKAEAREVLMPKKVTDSSIRCASEERKQGNARVAPTSTSDPPNVEGRTNLQSAQGVPPSTPQNHGWMDHSVQEDAAVDFANVLLNGATSYSRASTPLNSSRPDTPNDLLPNLSQSITLNAQRNPTAPLPSQNRPLLDYTSQNESQGSILPRPIASDARLTNMATTNTAEYSGQPLQSFHRQRERGTGVSPPRDPMDTEPPIPSRPGPPIIEPWNSPPQIPEDIINITDPSTSEVQPALVPPKHQSVPHQFISPETMNAQQNPTGLSSLQKNHTVPCHPQAPMNVDPCILLSSQAPNNVPPPPQIQRCGTVLIGPSSLPELDMSNGAPLTSYTNTNNNFEKSRALKRKIKQIYCREADIRDEIEFAMSLSLKKVTMEVKNWLADVEKLRNDFNSIEATSENCLPLHQQVDILMQEVEDIMERGKFLEGLWVRRETRVNKLLNRKLIGEAFQRNETTILEYLDGNQISRLGIYGMGGVGKTTLMVHIHNILLEKTMYDNVLWITVSQDFNTQKLQDDIWEALNLGILGEKDVRKRAAMLSNGLTKRGKLIIILDDVWECFNLEEVGIPVRADGLKLVLTTRSFDVCCQMHCQEKIKIEPLSQEEAESLFFEELGSEVAFNLETEAIAKSIVKELAGLPLGVITMAASMQEVTDMFEWKDCLVKSKELGMGQTTMEKRVLRNLEFSYDRLGSHEVQQCFLSCALYPKDQLIGKIELIEFFIDQGLIDGLNTRKEQYDKGLSILNKLENVCLLEGCKENDGPRRDDGERIKMHDLIRDMALCIMNGTSIVKASKRLTRIPPEEYWTDALDKVSLMNNNIREFPWNMSPNCPKLSTLLLNECSLRNVAIPDSFFKNLVGLKVLNLSGNYMKKIPNSISDLVNLRALVLRECRNLCRIPYLGKLASLKKLDVSGCKSLEALEGLEKLVNLRYLDVTETQIERLPKGTLDHLLYLQCLKVWAVNEEDITKLGALETFGCYYENADDFNKCVRTIGQSNNPCYYDLNVGLEIPGFIEEVSDDAQFGNLGRRVDIRGLEIPGFIVEVSDDAQLGNLGRRVDIRGWGHTIVSVGGECTGIFILIPRDVWTMTMRKCDTITNLSSMGPFEYLEELEIGEGENLGVLCGRQDEEMIDIHDSPAPTPTPLLFPNLRLLKIFRCPKLKYLFGHGVNLPHLRKIATWDCKEMVGIIAAVASPPPHLRPAFPSLEEIIVWGCDKMKRALESGWMPHFLNLRSIAVSKCEKMEEIIRGPPPYVPVEGISLESLVVYGCQNMRKLFPLEWLLHLRNLQSIEVKRCKGMVEMISGAGQGQEGSTLAPVNNTPSSFQPPISLPKLEQLKLCDLPELKSICEVPISCDSMKNLSVYECPELKEIPLQLRLCEIEELPHIWVDDEKKWKTLMWDHPNPQAILQSFLRKGEHANKESPLWWERWSSPNAIELCAKGKDLLQLRS